MRRAPLGRRPRRATLVLATAALVLSGCGGTGPAEETPVTSGHGEPAAATSPSPTPTPSRKPGRASSPTPSRAPSLPPGDPGLDAPAVPDPGVASAPHEGHGEARRTVPLAAMLTARTVRMVAGGGWERRAGEADECVRPEAARGVRSMAYGGTPAGVVVETVATYRDAAAADSAVTAIGSVAAGCGWEAAPDPRLGSASVAATDGPRSLVAVSAEGVVVVLVGSGDIAHDAMRWGSLVDLALGTSCPAAPDGCH